jgi:hypothetical protein
MQRVLKVLSDPTATVKRKAEKLLCQGKWTKQIVLPLGVPWLAGLARALSR